jgi:hypothetical protein
VVLTALENGLRAELAQPVEAPSIDPPSKLPPCPIPLLDAKVAGAMLTMTDGDSVALRNQYGETITHRPAPGEDPKGIARRRGA